MSNRSLPARGMRAVLVAAVLATTAATTASAPVLAGPTRRPADSSPSRRAPEPTTRAKPSKPSKPSKRVKPAVPAEPVKPVVPAGPVWLPLRHNVDGGEIKVGCTFDSHGSQFGYECGGHHDRWALDLIADAGTPVYASGAGFATNGTGRSGGSGYGNNVRIDHGGGVETIYAHLSEVLVPAEGAWVDQNTVIGKVGSTGSSSANHLHYEKRVTAPDGSTGPVDPGPLRACALGTVVPYPQVRGVASWQGVPWGAFTVFSDGTDCAAPPAPATR